MKLLTSASYQSRSTVSDSLKSRLESQKNQGDKLFNRKELRLFEMKYQCNSIFNIEFFEDIGQMCLNSSL